MVAVCERSSKLLADALVLARAQQGLHGQLVLSILGASTGGVLQLLKAAYSLQPILYFKSLAELQLLQALAEAANLLQCSALMELAEAALVNNKLVTPDNMLACSVWASQQRLPRFERYCNAYLLQQVQVGQQELDLTPFQGMPFVSALEQVSMILRASRDSRHCQVRQESLSPLNWPGSR